MVQREVEARAYFYFSFGSGKIDYAVTLGSVAALYRLLSPAFLGFSGLLKLDKCIA